MPSKINNLKKIVQKEKVIKNLKSKIAKVLKVENAPPEEIKAPLLSADSNKVFENFCNFFEFSGKSTKYLARSQYQITS